MTASVVRNGAAMDAATRPPGARTRLGVSEVRAVARLATAVLPAPRRARVVDQQGDLDPVVEAQPGQDP
jgi:hypothetical protein